MTAHTWCPCTTVPCGVGLTGHEGHCCLRAGATCTEYADGTDKPEGAIGWLTAHQDHCPTDHSARISRWVDLARKEATS